MSDKYAVTLRNKFNALKKISNTPTLIDEYENFVNAHIEAATDNISTKLRAKQNSVGEDSS